MCPCPVWWFTRCCITGTEKATSIAQCRWQQEPRARAAGTERGTHLPAALRPLPHKWRCAGRPGDPRAQVQVASVAKRNCSVPEAPWSRVIVGNFARQHQLAPRAVKQREYPHSVQSWPQCVPICRSAPRSPGLTLINTDAERAPTIWLMLPWAFRAMPRIAAVGECCDDP